MSNLAKTEQDYLVTGYPLYRIRRGLSDCRISGQSNIRTIPTDNTNKTIATLGLVVLCNTDYTLQNWLKKIIQFPDIQRNFIL